MTYGRHSGRRRRVRVWVALRDGQPVRPAGNAIPGNGRLDSGLHCCLHSAIERQRAAISNRRRRHMTHEGTNDATADEQASRVCDQVNVHMRPWQQPHFALRQQSSVRDVDNAKLTTRSQPYLRERLVGGDGPPGRPPAFDRALTAQQASLLFPGRTAARVSAR